MLFVFKPKTAYELRISDWISDVCSSNLFAAIGGPFELTTHRDGALTNEDLKGKPYLVFFGFTHCPDICPTTLFELTSLMQDLGPDAEKIRSEELRVGKECVRTGRFRWSPAH